VAARSEVDDAVPARSVQNERADHDQGAEAVLKHKMMWQTAHR
jgi:hypothetical protein